MEQIAPLAKILAEANGLDWRSLRGSGAGGTIVEQDVIDHLTRIMSGEEEPPSTPVDAPPPEWTGTELPPGGGLLAPGMPSMDMLSSAGVDSDLAALVAQPAPAARPAAPLPADDDLEFELEDEQEAVPVAPQHTPAPPPMPAFTARVEEAPAPVVPEVVPAIPDLPRAEPAPVTPPPPAAPSGMPSFSSPAFSAPVRPEPAAPVVPPPVTLPPVTPAAAAPTPPAPTPPAPTPATPPPPAAGGRGGLGGLLSRLYNAGGHQTPAPTPPPAEPTPPAPAPVMPSFAATPPAPVPEAVPVVEAPEVEVPAVEVSAAEVPVVERPAAERPVPPVPVPVQEVPVSAPARVEEPVEEQPAAAAPAAPVPSVPAPVAVPPVAAPAPAAPVSTPAPAPAAAGAPAGAVWFGTYLRREANLSAVSDLRRQLVGALSQDVPLALLVARAAQRHADSLNLHSVAVHDLAGNRPLTVQAGSLRGALFALENEHHGTPDLLVIDAGALDLDDLHLAHTVTLSVGRMQDGRAALTLNGNVEPAQAARFLAGVAGTLEEPIILVL